jgi:hypothetical protein
MNKQEFRASSAYRLGIIADELSMWLDDWTNYDVPPDVLDRQEYPFDHELGEMIARIYHAVELLQREPCPECGLIVADTTGSDHAVTCSHYLARHRRAPFTEPPGPVALAAAQRRAQQYTPRHRKESSEVAGVQRQRAPRHLREALGVDVLTVVEEPTHRSPTWAGLYGMAPNYDKPDPLTEFGMMVTAFRGGYHPDTTQYVRLPVGYTQERVDEIERRAVTAGLDLYAEALRVMGEAMSDDLNDT